MTLSVTKMWELMKFLSLTNAYYDGCFLMMDLKKYNSLTAKEQAIVEKGGEIATQRILVEVQSMYDDAIKDLTSNGVTIVEPDIKAFTEKTRPLYDQLLKELPHLEPMIKRAHSLRK